MARSQRSRSRTQSSLTGMLDESKISSSLEFALADQARLADDDVSLSTTSSPSNSLTEPERVSLSRGLRRAKRRLLLAAAAPPADSVGQLRELFRQVSVDCVTEETSRGNGGSGP